MNTAIISMLITFIGIFVMMFGVPFVEDNVLISYTLFIIGAIIIFIGSYIFVKSFGDELLNKIPKEK